MNYRSAAIILLSGIAAAMIPILLTLTEGLFESSYSNNLHWSDRVLLYSFLSASVPLAIAVLSFLRNGDFSRSKIALNIAAAAGLLQLAFILFLIVFSVPVRGWAGMPDLVIRLIGTLDATLFTLFVWKLARKPDSWRAPSIFLFGTGFVSLTSFLVQIHIWRPKLMYSYLFDYPTMVLPIFGMMLATFWHPISQLVFALFLYESDGKLTVSKDINDELIDSEVAVQEGASGQTETSVIRWIYFNFLALLPLVGLVLLMFWVAGKRRPDRRNWALATSIPVILLNVAWLRYVDYQIFDNVKSIWGVVTVSLAIFAVTFVLWLWRRKQQDADGETPVSVGSWFVRQLMSFIPLLGLVPLAMWFLSKKDKNRQLWATGQVIAFIAWMLICRKFFGFRAF